MQKTGNFAGVSVLFGVILVVFGFFIIAMKYAVRRQARRRAECLPEARIGSDSGAGSSVTAAAAAGGLSGDVGEGKGVGGLPVGDALVRPRAAAAAGADRV